MTHWEKFFLLMFIAWAGIVVIGKLEQVGSGEMAIRVAWAAAHAIAFMLSGKREP